MGMAASQARYLGLTARKSNVEYEGQQVNQQRVALANQSANLFNQLMAMQVPTPPSTSDYTTTQYSFTDGVNTYTISNHSKLSEADSENGKYNYSVDYYSESDEYTGYVKNINDPDVTQVGSTYYVNSHKTYEYDEDRDKTALTQIAADHPTSDVGALYTAGTTANIRCYTGGDGQMYYTTTTDLAASLATPTTPLEVAYANDSEQKIEDTSKAYIEFNDSGRLTNITLKNFDDETFNLHTETTTDDLAYEDAMNQYTYDVAVYEKNVQDINAKTEIIQQEDRTLELRLKQLDTEQEALSTEMDAVKKVIDKNIEQTFKTFA